MMAEFIFNFIFQAAAEQVTRFSMAKGVLVFMELVGTSCWYKLTPDFVVLCFHNTTNSCLRANNNGDPILHTCKQDDNCMSIMLTLLESFSCLQSQL